MQTFAKQQFSIQQTSKTCHMFRSECYLKMNAQYLGHPPPLNIG